MTDTLMNDGIILPGDVDELIHDDLEDRATRELVTRNSSRETTKPFDEEEATYM